MESNKINNKQSGVTILALIVAIIVILILAGITFLFLFEENGILSKSKLAYEEHRAGAVQDQRDLWFADVQSDKVLGTNKAKSVEQIVNELVEKKLLTSDEKDIILGNQEKGILAEGEIQIASKKIVFKEIYTARGDGNLNVGTGTEEDPYLIQSIEDLVVLSNKVNPIVSGPIDVFTGKHFKLVVNLDFQSRESYVNPDRTDFGDANQDGVTNTLIEEMTTGNGFRGIGKYTTNSGTIPFCGSIDGNNKKIKNLYSNKNFYGGFVIFATGNCTYKNLTLEGININYPDDARGEKGGLIAVCSGGTIGIDNCNIQGEIKCEKNASNVGGIIGNCTGAQITINNCKSKVEISGMEAIGGFVGKVEAGKININDSTNEGNIYAFNTSGSATSGFVGLIKNGASGEFNKCYSYGRELNSGYDGASAGILGKAVSAGDLKFSECENKAEVKSRVYGAGILGRVYGANSVVIDKSRNKGNIGIEKGVYSNGGIVGTIDVTTSSQIKECINEGEVYVKEQYAGGIIGECSGVIEKCYNKGTVKSEDESMKYTGYIAGIVGCATNVLVKNCVNDSKVEAPMRCYIGGIVGNSLEQTEVLDSYNRGDITGYESVGGILGSYSGSENASVTRCYNTNAIKGVQKVGGIVGTNASVLYSFNLGNIVENPIGQNINFGSISGNSAIKTNNAYLASTYSVGSGEEGYTDSDSTTKRVDNVNDLYLQMQSTLTGENWVLKSGDNIPTLNL